MVESFISRPNTQEQKSRKKLYAVSYTSDNQFFKLRNNPTMVLKSVD